MFYKQLHIACADPKSVKIQSSCQYLFTLLGSMCTKASCKMMMKLTPDYLYWWFAMLEMIPTGIRIWDIQCELLGPWTHRIRWMECCSDVQIGLDNPNEIWNENLILKSRSLIWSNKRISKSLILNPLWRSIPIIMPPPQKYTRFEINLLEIRGRVAIWPFWNFCQKLYGLAFFKCWQN